MICLLHYHLNNSLRTANHGNIINVPTNGYAKNIYNSRTCNIFLPMAPLFLFPQSHQTVCQKQNWFSSSPQRATAIDLSFCYQRDQGPLSLKSSLTSSQPPSNSQFNQFFSHDAFQIYLWISSLTASILDKVHVPVVCSASLITIL